MISADEELRRLQRAIEALPLPCRRGFMLRRVHHRSTGEIAAEMGLPIAIVRKHLSGAILLLTRAVAESGDGASHRDGPDSGEEKALDEAAARLFVRLLDDGSDDARRTGRQWLSADPRHALAYARIEMVWGLAAGLVLVAPAPDHDDRPRADRSAMPPGCDQ